MSRLRLSINPKSRSAITAPSPERTGSPSNSPCGETIAVKQPPEIGPIEHPADLTPALKKGIDIVKRGEPVIIDVAMQPR